MTINSIVLSISILAIIANLIILLTLNKKSNRILNKILYKFVKNNKQEK